MTTFGLLRRLLREQPLKMVTIVGALVAAGVLEGSGIALFFPLLQMISAPGENDGSFGMVGDLIQGFMAFVGLPMTLGSVLALILFVVLCLQLVTVMQQRLSLRYQYLFEAALRERLITAVFSAEWRFFLKQKAGDITNALTAEVVRAGSAFYMLNLIMAVLTIIAIYAGLALAISWRMVLTAGVIGTGVTLGLQSQIKRATAEGSEITRANEELQSEAIEQISGAKLVKGCAVEEETIARFKQSFAWLADAQFVTFYNNAKLRAFNELAMVGLLCAGIYFAVAQLDMKVSTLIIFLVIFYRIAPRLTNVQTFRRGLRSCLPAFDRIDALVDEAERMKETGGVRPIASLSDELVFKDVDFAYDAGHTVITDLNLRVPRGKTIAVVGSSGAGKSTIVDLIMGLIYPTSGSVLVDGHPLQEYDLASWRRLIGYVAQDATLFHASVKANIMRTAPAAEEEDIERAVRSANALDFIEQLPEGFDTIIGDRGVRLSGGQKQRLALASALARNPQILILDEATSALDAESEQKIQAAVELLARSEMTIVVITHRLATVKNADLIYVLENGKLIEEGSWEMLVNKKGRFQRLKHLQALD